jgi:hypothetical protein
MRSLVAKGLFISQHAFTFNLLAFCLGSNVPIEFAHFRRKPRYNELTPTSASGGVLISFVIVEDVLKGDLLRL